MQGFYDWYIGKGGWNTAMALRNKRWPLGTELASALEAELEAPEDSSGDVDSFDFDPFLDAQDTCFPYKAGKTSPDGSRYRVEVFASNCEGLQPGKPIVIAVVESHAGSWDFVNFIYPGDAGHADTDMWTDLKEFKKEREEHLKKNPAPKQN